MLRPLAPLLLLPVAAFAVQPKEDFEVCAFDTISLLQVLENSFDPQIKHRKRHRHFNSHVNLGTNITPVSHTAQHAGATPATNISLSVGNVKPIQKSQWVAGEGEAQKYRVEDKHDMDGIVGKRGQEVDQKKLLICSIMFFTDDNFKGIESQFILGSYSASNLQYFHGFLDNAVSSFMILGLPNCLVSLYGGKNFDGWHAKLYPGEWSTSEAIAHGFRNDELSSFRLELVDTTTSTTAPSTTTRTSRTSTTQTTTSRTHTSKTKTTITTKTQTYTSTTKTLTSTTFTLSTTTHTHTSTSRSTTSHTHTTYTLTSITTTQTSISLTTTTTLTTFSSTTITQTTTTVTQTTTTYTRTSTTRTTITYTHTTKTTTSGTSTTGTSTTHTHTATTNTFSSTTFTWTSTTHTHSTTTHTGTSQTKTTTSMTQTTTTTTTQTSTTSTRTTTTSTTTTQTQTTTTQTATSTTSTTTATSTTTSTTTQTTSSTTTSSTTVTDTSTLTTTSSTTYTPSGVEVTNNGFEDGSSTATYEDSQCNVPRWTATASTVDGEQTCPIFVRSGQAADALYGGTNAAEGSYFLALRRRGSAIEQSVPKHTFGQSYRLEFYLAKRGAMSKDPTVRVLIDGQASDFVADTRAMRLKFVNYNAASELVSIKFENVSPDPYPTAFIDNIGITSVLVTPAVCSSLLYAGNVWGSNAAGIDVARYTSGTLKWIGCNGNGCARTTFYCNDVAGVGLEFGTTDSTALRALLGSVIPSSALGCASASQPDGLTNAPDKAIDVHELCTQLGYATGELVASGPSNSCPEVHWKSSTSSWTSDFVMSTGYGKQFRCLTTAATTSTTTVR